ncbi:serine/threonine protein phosphatase [Escherichia coli]|nr:serine/threonine protein phosphatase [Escherichia coli]
MLRLLNQPWFISVKGNHEAMALDAFETGDGNMWLASGGDWFFDLNDSEQQEAIDLLLKFHHLPHIIEITNDTIKYVIAHADYPGKEYQFGKEITENELLWPVDRVQKSLNSELQKINGADFFIFGHMMFDNIQTFANQIYIDTGSPKSGRLSFYKIK